MSRDEKEMNGMEYPLFDFVRSDRIELMFYV